MCRFVLLAWAVLCPTVPMAMRRFETASAMGPPLASAWRPTPSFRTDAATVSAGHAAEINAAIEAGVRYLTERQSPDGAWRSEVYAVFRAGGALTPLMLTTLIPVQTDHPVARNAVHHGVAFLMSMIDGQGRLHPLPDVDAFPVYSASMAGWVLGMEAPMDRRHAARSAWLDHLRARRLGSELGWKPSDPQFGGWGYATVIPLRPKTDSPAELAHESNLSATLFGLAALRLSGVASDDPAIVEVRRFVERCQNYAHADFADSAYDDGGFFLSTTDAARNKAGESGTDPFGRSRMRSYGSATADGLRSLLLCGAAPDHPRVAAARRWLETHFTAESNPGAFPVDRGGLRHATYYYYCWSVSHALARMGRRELPSPSGPVDWAAALTDELIRRQRPDGSWRNDHGDSKEDDPLVATSFAIAALAVCRTTMIPAVGTAGSPRDHGRFRLH